MLKIASDLELQFLVWFSNILAVVFLLKTNIFFVKGYTNNLSLFSCFVVSGFEFKLGFTLFNYIEELLQSSITQKLNLKFKEMWSS